MSFDPDSVVAPTQQPPISVSMDIMQKNITALEEDVETLRLRLLQVSKPFPNRIEPEKASRSSKLAPTKPESPIQSTLIIQNERLAALREKISTIISCVEV